MMDVIAHGGLYILAGIFAGLMSGILGIGGGVVVVPLLLFIFTHNQVIPLNYVMHFAAGTSLAIMLFTSQSTIYSHYKIDGVLWHVYRRLWPGIVIGTIIGAILADQLPTEFLKILFGLFLLFVAAKMLSGINVTHPSRFPKPWLNGLVSCLIGFKSGLLGVGGGTLIIPYLTYCGVPMKKIAGVSSLCTLTVAILGTITFIITGLDRPDLPDNSIGYIYWPAVIWVAIPSALFAPLGARLTYILPVKQLKYGFIVILTLTALDLLFMR